MDKKMRVVLAEQEAVDQFPQQVDKVIEVMGIGAALVTDLSQVMDFLMPIVRGMDKAELASAQDDVDKKLGNLTSLVGRKVQAGDYIWELARDLYNREKSLKSEAAQKARPH